MRKEGGITLLSLIIYVILMIFVVAAVSNITASFYSNLNQFDNESESAVAYSKFNMYFLNDMKKENVEVEEANTNYIILSIDNQMIEYSVQNKALYRNKVKICDNVQDVQITADKDQDTIKVHLKIGDYEKTTTYVIERVEITNNTQVI